MKTNSFCIGLLFMFCELSLIAQNIQLEVRGVDEPDATTAKFFTSYQGTESAMGLESRATSNAAGIGGSFVGSFRGLQAFSATGHGISTSANQSYGIYASSAIFPAGYFVFENKLSPDLIIGGTGNNNPGDDCRIGSDPQYGGSDLFLRSNDAIVFELDYNNDEEGQFEIRNSNANVIFKVDEVGKAQLNGSQSVMELKTSDNVNGSVLVLNNASMIPSNLIGSINFASGGTPGQISYSTSHTMDFRVSSINSFMQLTNGANHILMSNGAKLTSGGMWMDVSTIIKKNLEELVPVESVLASLLALPIYFWRYKTDPNSLHIGPTAEDFYEQFGLGEDNKSLSPSDLASVAISSIQAIKKENDLLKEDILNLKSDLRLLETMLSARPSKRKSKRKKM